MTTDLFQKIWFLLTTGPRVGVYFILTGHSIDSWTYSTRYMLQGLLSIRMCMRSTPGVYSSLGISGTADNLRRGELVYSIGDKQYDTVHVVPRLCTWSLMDNFGTMEDRYYCYYHSLVDDLYLRKDDGGALTNVSQ